MEFKYKGLEDADIELFVEFWDKANDMLSNAIGCTARDEEDEIFLRWFKDLGMRDTVSDTLDKMLSFFHEEGILTIVKGGASDSDEPNVHGKSEEIREGVYRVIFPAIFFDRQAFKRQPDVILHEVSHLAADTKDLEMPPRAGNAKDPIEINVFGIMQSPEVKRSDSYYRYHTESEVTSSAEAICCASSYEFYIKGVWLAREKQSSITEQIQTAGGSPVLSRRVASVGSVENIGPRL